MPSFHYLAQRVIKDADIILMVIDARMPESTVNQHLLDSIGEKKLLYVINKIDLVDEAVWQALKKRLRPSVAVSSTKHLGTMMLLRKINAIAHGAEVVVGVVGYPNTGKSSLINALRSRQAASVSPVAGHTRAIQKIRVSKHVVLLDTPGVIPYADKHDPQAMAAHEVLGTVDVMKIKDPELAFYRLAETMHDSLAMHYRVHAPDAESLLVAIAQSKNILRKGGEPDLPRMARAILRDYQTGKLR